MNEEISLTAIGKSHFGKEEQKRTNETVRGKQGLDDLSTEFHSSPFARLTLRGCREEN